MRTSQVWQKIPRTCLQRQHKPVKQVHQECDHQVQGQEEQRESFSEKELLAQERLCALPAEGEGPAALPAEACSPSRPGGTSDFQTETVC